MSEAVIADFITIITADAVSLQGLVYDYHEDLGTQLFALGRIDLAERRTALAGVSAAGLIGLRTRLEGLLEAVKTALALSGI